MHVSGGPVHGVPHPFPYQGSKRQQAKLIVECIPPKTYRLVEPFLGAGAIAIAAAFLDRTTRFLFNDINAPLVDLWREILDNPEGLAERYRYLWNAQQGREREYFDRVRASFNQSQDPHKLLYLLARCVKAAIRYNRNGEFNNSPDNRRKGMHPSTMRKNLRHVSNLLRGRVRLSCKDYRNILEMTTPKDIVYMDPPYQGVCDTRDNRYSASVPYDEFVDALNSLNRRRVPFIVSYDGRTGETVHGKELPANLDLLKYEVAVGRSTQSTLLGRHENTVEALYLSAPLVERLGETPRCAPQCDTLPLFAGV